MDSLSELSRSLAGSFKWNKARIFCLAGMLLALITVRTVNLKSLAIAFISDAQIDSRYKRLSRFFAYFKVDFTLIARWIFSLFFTQGQKMYLTVDRTNWYWGKSKINVLTLGVAYEGMAIPLFWRALDKAGNATAQEHIAIIKEFVRVFGHECIAGVLMDREFGSHELFSWCNQNHKIPFYVRIKDNALVRIFKGKARHVQHLFSELNPKQQNFYPYPVQLYGVTLYVAGSRSERGELMIVATNQHPKNAIVIYLRRWEIETLFSCLKGRGFNFEDTRLTQLDRVEKLMAVLSMAVAWVHKLGEWRAEQRPIRFKKFRDGQQRPQYSYFRYGLDFIQNAIFQSTTKKQPLLQCIQILFNPLPLGELI